METILFILLGMFIGWNFPQPTWAKYVQRKMVDFLRKVFTKGHTD